VGGAIPEVEEVRRIYEEMVFVKTGRIHVFGRQKTSVTYEPYFLRLLDLCHLHRWSVKRFLEAQMVMFRPTRFRTYPTPDVLVTQGAIDRYLAFKQLGIRKAPLLRGDLRMEGIAMGKVLLARIAQATGESVESIANDPLLRLTVAV